jgi:hypothetical protein
MTLARPGPLVPLAGPAEYTSGETRIKGKEIAEERGVRNLAFSCSEASFRRHCPLAWSNAAYN